MLCCLQVGEAGALCLNLRLIVNTGQDHGQGLVGAFLLTLCCQLGPTNILLPYSLQWRKVISPQVGIPSKFYVLGQFLFHLFKNQVETLIPQPTGAGGWITVVR